MTKLTPRAGHVSEYDELVASEDAEEHDDGRLAPVVHDMNRDALALMNSPAAYEAALEARDAELAALRAEADALRSALKLIMHEANTEPYAVKQNLIIGIAYSALLFDAAPVGGVRGETAGGAEAKGESK